MRIQTHITVPFLVFGLCASASAQGALFDSPGQSLAPSGQIDRFSNEFNPAIGVVIDFAADAVDPEDGNSGADAAVRTLELNLSANIDPNAWAYVTVVSADLESPEIEEAAVEYTGLSGNQTLRVGRFFVDFGKQMQMHPEELRTFERPLPLREFLGDELAGVGVQYDNWFALNDTTPLRFSLGAFSSLLGEGHGHGEEEGGEPETHVPDRKDLDEISFTARLTAMTEVGENGVLQLGTSVRHAPEFAFEEEDAGLEMDGLSNTVYGADVTYSTTDETGQESWLFGGEVLLFDGDLSAELDDPMNPTALLVVDDETLGWFGFADWGIDTRNSVGLQYGMAELPEDPSEDASELELYFTHHLTELRRLRIGVRHGEVAGVDEDAIYVQFTNYFGNHTHGLNW